MKTRILHVVTSLEPGGMENGIVNVARALDPAEWEIHAACLERLGAFAARLPEPGNSQVLGKTSGFSTAAARALRRRIAACRPDVIHSHNLGPLIYSALATLGGRTVPVLQGEHAQLTDEERASRRLRQRRWLYRCCEKVHTVSRGQRDELLALGFPAEKISVVMNGVDTARFSPGDRAAGRLAAGLPADALSIGIVGRFGAFKRHAMLLDVFEKIAREFPALHLLIVGAGGPEAERVAQKVEASAHRARIHAAGFQAEPAAFYRAMDLLVVPSVNEGLSNAVLEAMACGTPVLAHSACGNAEAITHARDGFLADLGTPDTLQAELTRALREPGGLRECGQRAREKVVAHFSIAAMVAGYETLYRECAGRRLR